MISKLEAIIVLAILFLGCLVFYGTTQHRQRVKECAAIDANFYHMPAGSNICIKRSAITHVK
jgi:hypothetical protein